MRPWTKCRVGRAREARIYWTTNGRIGRNEAIVTEWQLD